MPRIVSFLPAATEIAFAIGAGSDLVGRSHECDYPEEVKNLPVVSKPTLPIGEMSLEEIDRAVASQLASGESLYKVDEVLLRQLDPDIVLTQDLCQVCAPSGNELGRALRELPASPEVVWLTPRTLGEIRENIGQIGRVTGRMAGADDVIAEFLARTATVADAMRDVVPRRMVFLEWTEPPFCAGHWVPEMIAIAGGVDSLSQFGADSLRVTWEAITAASPEIIVVAPCGYGLQQSRTAAAGIPRLPGARIFAVDANAYFARPGPRVAEGIELLAHLFHPDRVAWPHAHRPWADVT
ncbi:MAG: cobalamin-binding protein [Anaerolineae bacterium]|nr:cobalamin-binding protein [Gemmatimonadaceae bacterium]